MVVTPFATGRGPPCRKHWSLKHVYIWDGVLGCPVSSQDQGFDQWVITLIYIPFNPFISRFHTPFILTIDSNLGRDIQAGWYMYASRDIGGLRSTLIRWLDIISSSSLGKQGFSFFVEAVHRKSVEVVLNLRLSWVYIVDIYKRLSTQKVFSVLFGLKIYHIFSMQIESFLEECPCPNAKGKASLL